VTREEKQRLEQRAELQRRLDGLRLLRAQGTSEIDRAGVHERFNTDRELAAAIADVERQIASFDGTPVSTILVSSSKGLTT
jgi:hypothetical protein